MSVGDSRSNRAIPIRSGISMDTLQLRTAPSCRHRWQRWMLDLEGSRQTRQRHEPVDRRPRWYALDRLYDARGETRALPQACGKSNSRIRRYCHCSSNRSLPSIDPRERTRGECNSQGEIYARTSSCLMLGLVSLNRERRPKTARTPRRQVRWVIERTTTGFT